MTTHNIADLNGNRITYNEYIVKAGETTLHQIARDQLYDESRFKEIKEWKNNTVNEVTKALTKDQVLLIPPVSAWVLKLPDSAAGDTSFQISSDGNYVRSGPSKNEYIDFFLALKNTPFLYKRQKGSLIKGEQERLWVKVYFNPYYKDKSNVFQPVGWICVKEGNTYYTNPHIDIPTV